MSFALFQNAMQDTTLAMLSNHLTFKKIDELGMTSRLGQDYAKKMKTEKLKIAFQGSSLPLEKLTGIFSISPFIRFLDQSPAATRSQIACLDLRSLTPSKAQIIKLLDLCPKIKRILLHTFSNIPPDLLNRLLKLPTCKRIHLPYETIRTLAAEHLHKVYGTTLAPSNNEELQSQIEQMTISFPHLRQLSISGQFITTIPPLPDSIQELEIHCQSLKLLNHLPSQLNKLDISGCALEKPPAIPSHVQLIKNIC